MAKTISKPTTGKSGPDDKGHGTGRAPAPKPKPKK
jgi:hypothetical protein